MDINQFKDKSVYVTKKIIEEVSNNGGYLSSNLSCVDINVALYSFLNKQDKIFFCSDDLKMGYEILANDKVEVASLSSVLASCIVRDLNHENYKICLVLNSSYVRSGKDIEALNEISKLNSQLLIVFNDDTMISQGIGFVDKFISNLRNTKTYNNIKEKTKDAIRPHRNGNKVIEEIHNIKSDLRKSIMNEGIFGSYDIDYQGPIDGNNYNELIRALEISKSKNYPTVIHCISQSGKGYKYAEACTTDYWYKVNSFNIETGKPLVSEIEGYKYAKNVLSDELAKIMLENKDILVLSDDRLIYDGVSKLFSHFPERTIRCFNICNELEMALRFSKEGKIPFLTIKSSELKDLYAYMTNLSDYRLIIGLNNDNNDLNYFNNLENINKVFIDENTCVEDEIKRAIALNNPTVFVYVDKIIKLNRN